MRIRRRRRQRQWRGNKDKFSRDFCQKTPDENIKRLVADKLRILANSHYSLVNRNDVATNAKCVKSEVNPFSLSLSFSLPLSTARLFNLFVQYRYIDEPKSTEVLRIKRKILIKVYINIKSMKLLIDSREWNGWYIYPYLIKYHGARLMIIPLNLIFSASITWNMLSLGRVLWNGNEIEILKRQSTWVLLWSSFWYLEV